ncbi:MAG: energy-coupling factor ABC transporter ATP-binding protein [Bacillota bacterium]
MDDMRCNDTPYIELQDVCYRYPGGSFSVENISLAFDVSRITAIVGQNGSGKTTLGKLMAGILKPQSGEILLCGADTKKMALHDFGKKIGYLFQNPERQIFAQTVEEEITFSQELLGVPPEKAKEKCDTLLKAFHLEHLRDALPLKLSRGEKQRLVIAAIFTNEPGFLLLDEPSTALDRERKEVLYEMLRDLREKGIGITVITHDDGFVERYAQRVITMEEGRVIRDECT